MTDLTSEWRPYAEALDRLHRLSQDMFEAVGRGAWTELRALDGRRLTLIQNTAMPQGDPGPAVTALLRDKLQTILTLNERLLQLGASRCGELQRQIHRLSAGRTALRAYADNSY